MRTRVLIADDHRSVLGLVSEMLEPEYDVVAAVTDGLTALDAALVLRPDIAILDISMPILSGFETAARLVASGCALRVLFLTMHEDPCYVEAARNVGACGYVVKRSLTAELLPAIRHALEGPPSFADVSAAGAGHAVGHVDPSSNRRR